MKAPAILIFSLVFIVLFVSGCTAPKFGFKEKKDCDGLKEDEKILCYHEAAITKAYLNDKGGAIDTCRSMLALGLAGDQILYAEAEKNICLSDVSVILKDKDGCKYIDQTIANTKETGGLKGATTAQKVCFSKVESRAKITPDNYQCPLISILLFSALFVGSLRIGKN